MASDDPRAVTVTDLDAREVVLLARVWEDNFTTRDHPELIDQLDAVIQTVSSPDPVEPDALPNRTGSTDATSGPAAG
jgi:hypothetical protein